MKKVGVIGSFSGRNAGDTAILGNLLEDFSRIRDDILFVIPTLNPSFVNESFGKYRIRPIGMMPWHLSLKALGLANLLAMTRTDMVLITDNALFDRKLYNPLVNTLFTIALLAPVSRKLGIPIVFYNASIGPIDTKAGHRMLQKVLDATKLLTLRDPITQELLRNQQLLCPSVHLKADCAINTEAASEERVNQICRDENVPDAENPGFVCFNVNAYIDNWSNQGTLNRSTFCKMIAGAADRVMEQLGVGMVFIVTQIMDRTITRECIDQMKNKANVGLVGNDHYSYSDIAGVLQRAGTFIGLRTHALIFCAAVNTPMISINSYPKNAGFMRSIYQDEWMIEFSELTEDAIVERVSSSWRHQDQRRDELTKIVPREKLKARESADLVSDLLDLLG